VCCWKGHISDYWEELVVGTLLKMISCIFVKHYRVTFSIFVMCYFEVTLWSRVYI